ncbi:Uncharacterized protein family UPF0118 [Macleaya cordata]|uniref:Uncharacterized protein family UPF0118 n=1 Tax=Macleaya cordata TaxID=56857 RepID=A0A200RD42_MACCD|nr:Uncharacterized protein family UPF0118 [Macleaya cordata]
MSETEKTTSKSKPKRNRHHKKQQKSKQDEEEEEDDEEQPKKQPQQEEHKKHHHLRTKSPLSTTDPQLCLAIYIAMAHAGLALSVAILYGLSKLLQQYLRPIQWAILCSMPLRELHSALVRFWSHPLHLGLFETLIAIPVAVLRATTGSLIDSHVALLRLLHNRHPVCPNEKVGFSKLMQWIVSFGVFVFVYERIGPASIPAFTVPCLFAYATGCGTPSTPGVASTLSAISSARRNKIVPKSSIWSRISRYITSVMLKRLKVTVCFGLIMFMIVGSVSGFVLFSYKIGMEGKDAVISLKTHLQENNYAERIGLNKWMDENQVPELIDTYSTKFCQTVSQQIDSLALQYNVTEIVKGVQQYLIKPLGDSFNGSFPEKVRHRPFSEKLYCLQAKVRNREWKVIFRDINGVFRVFISVIAKDDLLEEVKGFVLRSLDISKQLFVSSTMVLAGSANLLFSLVISVVSGAAGLFNFVSQMMVFFWLLYYLITSDSGGAMDHVLGMLPLSKSTRVRCAVVLDHAVSSVLLATAKVAFFQGCLTYLLFRFYSIHFLYMCTFLAVMSAAITPTWLSSIPAAAQLAIEARYVEAVLLTVIHLVLMDFGTEAIQEEIPGHSSYLTGLSILGGMALFPSVLEGAIMGPVLMTVMIALKNLYVEFVLASGK